VTNTPSWYMIVRTFHDGSKRVISDLMTLESATQECQQLNGDTDAPEFAVHPAQAQ
jgi:hypothetical protein